MRHQIGQLHGLSHRKRDGVLEVVDGAGLGDRAAADIVGDDPDVIDFHSQNIEILFGNSVFDPAMKHEAAHGQIDEGFGDLGVAFVVAAQTPGTAQPAEGAFDHPAARQHDETALGVRAADNLQRSGSPCLPSGRVSPRSSHRPTDTAAGHRLCRLWPGVGARLRDPARWPEHGDPQQQPQRVHQNVTLAPVDLLARVVAALPARLAGLGRGRGHAVSFKPRRRLDRLAPPLIVGQLTARLDGHACQIRSGWAICPAFSKPPFLLRTGARCGH